MDKVNIIDVRAFSDRDSVTLYPIYQYDVGQILRFEDVFEDGTLVQFKYQNTTMDKPIVNNQVQIPSELLKDSTEVVAWVQIIDSESETTIKEIKIPIRIKNQGAGVTTPDDEQTFKEWIEQTMNDAKAIAEEAKEAVENFELSEEQIEEVAKNIDLSGYVPTTRKIANQPLSEDVTPLQIINAIFGSEDSRNTLTNGVDYYLLGGKGSLQTTDKTNYANAINEVNSIAKEADSIAKQANKAVAFYSYSIVINMLNKADSDAYKIGQSMYIQKLNVPDLWVYGVTSVASVQYEYTTDDAFIEEMNRVGFVQVGYYYIAPLETQKVDLTNYDTSEEVDEKISTAITEALNNMPIAEGSEF